MNNIVNLSNDEKALIVEKKATCPFIGAAVAQDQLPVRNDKQNPLASIEQVRELGNRGGGHLGEVLVLFASGNHSRMRDDSGALNAQVEEGLFSLEFPGSQGSHPGHSGILQGDPKLLDSGRLDKDNFARLKGRATRDGLIKRSEVGRFIAENVFRDPNSKVVGANGFAELTRDFASLLTSLLLTAVGRSNLRELLEKFTKLTGEDNLIGSAGEFGLLFAFFANKPGAEEVDGEPTLAVDDLELMFVQKRLPAGWETWKKSRRDWGTNTTALMHTAREEYNRLKRDQ